MYRCHEAVKLTREEQAIFDKIYYQAQIDFMCIFIIVIIIILGINKCLNVIFRTKSD